MLQELPVPGDIEAAAKERGWSMYRLFKESGVDKVTFWRWKTGKGSISYDSLAKLLDALEQ